jgi:hypothetical protein
MAESGETHTALVLAAVRRSGGFPGGQGCAMFVKLRASWFGCLAPGRESSGFPASAFGVKRGIVTLPRGHS